MKRGWIATSVVCVAVAVAAVGEAKGPFSVRDSRLLETKDSCRTDITISRTPDGYSMGGKLQFKDGKPLIWCPGARHTWEGDSNDIQGGAIRRIESDAAKPLVFQVTRNAGYVYRGGRGTIVLADGTSVALPPGSRPSTPADTGKAAASEPQAYSGANQCPGMFVNVSFVKDPAGYLRDFKAEHGCKGEGAGVTWGPDAPIPVKEDGSYRYEDNYGNSVAGKVTERGARGRFTGGVSIKCKKSGRFTPMCKNWRAAPQK